MYKKILVPVDGSEASKGGLEEAAKLAKSAGGSLRLVHVVNEYVLDSAYDPVGYSERLFEGLRESGRRILEEAQAAARAAGVEAQIHLAETIGGPAADPILEQAGQWPADLIVMGTHGRRGVRRLVMGSDAEQVVRASPVPVLLVRGPAERPAKG